MRWIFVPAGGLAFFVVSFLVGGVTGAVLHGEGGLLEPAYRAHAQLWRPELNATPPDLGALMPLWLATGVLHSMIVALVYLLFAPALRGGVLANGLRFGVAMSLLMAGTYAMLYGVFALDGMVWAWWAVEGLVTYLLGGITLAFVAARMLPPDTN